MLLLRILGDYQTKLRYAHDQQLEKEAYEALQAKESVDERIEKALNTLRKTWLEPVGVKERFQMQRLADEALPELQNPAHHYPPQRPVSGPGSLAGYVKHGAQ